MSRFALKLSALIAFPAFLIVANGFLAANIVNEPFGVSKAARPHYKKKIQEAKEVAAFVNENADKLPIAKATSTHHDFGYLAPESTGTHAFRVRNNGQGPLTLKVLSTTCKCTVGKATSPVVLPGQSTDIVLEWNTGQKSEHYTQTATVKTNDPLNERIKLTVSGQIRTKIKAASPNLHFGTTDLKTHSTGSTLLYSQLWEDFTIENVNVNLPGASWSVEPTSETESLALASFEPTSAWKLTVSYIPTTRDSIRGDVTFEVVGPDGSREPFSMPIAGSVRAPVNFYGPDIHATEGVDFGTRNRGSTVQKSLVVRVRVPDDSPIEVLKTEPPQLQTKLIRTGEKQYRLTMTIPADCEPVLFNQDSKHGYVHVGSKDHPQIMNWFPVWGAVVDPR